MSGRPQQQKLVVGDVSLTTGLVMNQNYESAPEGEGDQYDHHKGIPLTADGFVIPTSVRGLHVLQQNMGSRVPAAVLDVTVQAAFQQLVPPELRGAIHVLAEWDAGWFDDLDKGSVFADIGAVYSHGDRAFEAACADTLRPRIADEADGTLPPLARTLRSHAWIIGPLRLTGGYWAGALVRLEGLDPATGLYTRVAQVALVDPRRDDRLAAEGNRALRRLEHALAQTGLALGRDGDDATRPGSDAWTRAAWRRSLWVPRQMHGNDGSCGPRYYVLAKAFFARLAALWERDDGARSGGGAPPYDEALWTTPLSGWFHHEATRWEMVGHHAARAVRDASYQARVTAEVIRTQNGGTAPARVAMRLPPAPTYEAAPSCPASLFAPAVSMPSAAAAAAPATGAAEPSLSWFAPEVFPSTMTAAAATMASRNHHLPYHPPADDTNTDTTTTTTTTTTGTATSRKRRRASDAAAPQPDHANKRCCRLRVTSDQAPPNNYPVYPLRELDPWDWRHVRWALENPFEARLLNMHMAHYLEEMMEARQRGDDDGGMGHGPGGGRGHGRGGSDDDDNDDDESGGNGHGHGHGHGHGGGANDGDHDDDDDDNDNNNSRGETNSGLDTSRSGPAISSSDENLDSDGRLQAVTQKATQATGEKAETFQRRYQMEVSDRAREDARARDVPMHDRESGAEGSQQQQQQEQQQGRQQGRGDGLSFADGSMNVPAMAERIERLIRFPWRR